jgi:hypothetical protein
MLTAHERAIRYGTALETDEFTNEYTSRTLGELVDFNQEYKALALLESSE